MPIIGSGPCSTLLSGVIDGKLQTTINRRVAYWTRYDFRQGRNAADSLMARSLASGIPKAGHFDDDAIVELAEVVAWENAPAKFNRALRIPSQGLWWRSE